MKRPTAHTDPSGLFGAVGTAAAAVLTLLVAFGVPLTADQSEAILGVVAVAGPLWTAWAIRRHAWAPRTVDVERTDAYSRGVDDARHDPQLAPPQVLDRRTDGEDRLPTIEKDGTT